MLQNRCHVAMWLEKYESWRDKSTSNFPELRWPTRIPSSPSVHKTAEWKRLEVITGCQNSTMLFMLCWLYLTWCRWDILWEFYSNPYSQPLLLSKQSGVRTFLKIIFFLYLDCYNTYHYIKRTICFWIWLSIYNFSAIWLRISLSIKLKYIDWKLVCITQKEKS